MDNTPTATNRQPPIATNRQSPTANRQPPPTMVEYMSYMRSFCKTAVQEPFFFLKDPLLQDHTKMQTTVPPPPLFLNHGRGLLHVFVEREGEVIVPGPEAFDEWSRSICRCVYGQSLIRLQVTANEFVAQWSQYLNQSLGRAARNATATPGLPVEDSVVLDSARKPSGPVGPVCRGGGLGSPTRCLRPGPLP